MWSHSEQAVPKWSTTCTGKSLLMAVHSCTCFSHRGDVHVLFLAPQSRFGGHPCQVTCEMRYFQETSMEFLLPWPPVLCACAVSPPEHFTSFTATVCSSNMGLIPPIVWVSPTGCISVGSWAIVALLKALVVQTLERDQNPKFPSAGEGIGCQKF